MKKRIRLNESELKRMISESVRRVLKEGSTKGIPYKHFPQNSYDKAAKIEWSLYDIEKMLEKLKGLYNDEYSDEFDRRIQDVYSFACDALELMDKYGLNKGGFNSDDYYVDDAISINESDYNDFFDWAKNSNTSPEEIEAAGQRHDSRIPSIYDDYDKLERRQKNNERYRKQIEHGYITPSKMRDYQKFDIKNDRSGGKLFTDRLMKGLIPKNFRN